MISTICFMASVGVWAEAQKRSGELMGLYNTFAIVAFVAGCLIMRFPQ
jgi:hypothetical protein